MKGRLYLAGGGSPEQSFQLDRDFVSRCRPYPLVYIPTALRSQPPEASLDWFRSAMQPHAAPKIEMWPDLKPTLPVGQVGGIYIGGGDTVFLLQEALRTGFDTFLRDALKLGVPVYGGSAGAIILGERIGASKSAAAAGQAMTAGLGLLSGYSVACHFQEPDIDRVQAWSVSLGAPVIAIPEAAGVALEADELLNFGTVPVTVLDGAQTTSVPAGGSIKLPRRD